MFFKCTLCYSVGQRDPTGGPLATFGPTPLVTRLTELFVNLLLVATSVFILFVLMDFRKKDRDSYLVCFVTYKSNLKPFPGKKNYAKYKLLQ
jgi:hypothetical protein